MIKLLRRLFGRSQNASSDTQPAWAPRQFVYVMIPGDIQPLVRGQRFEDPLEELLQAAELGSVSGGGSQLDDPYPDGRPRVWPARGLRTTPLELVAPDVTELAAIEDRIVELTRRITEPGGSLRPS